jgi:hypothetical protein
MANLQLSEHGQLVSDAYNYYNTTKDSADTVYNREYTAWADSINQAMQMVQMQNTDYWNQTNFDEGVRQYEKNFTESQRQFNKDLELNQAKFDWEKEMAEKEFGAKYVSDGKGGYVSKTSTGDGSGKPYTLTDTEIKTIQDKYKEGGVDAVMDYLRQKGKAPTNEEEADIIASVYGGQSSSPTSAKKWYEQDWVITKDTKNWNNPFSKGNEDMNDKFNLGEGTEEYTYKELKNKINNEKGLTDEQKKAFLKKISGQSLR